jgi:hypothetical protein
LIGVVGLVHVPVAVDLDEPRLHRLVVRLVGVQLDGVVEDRAVELGERADDEGRRVVPQRPHRVDRLASRRIDERDAAPGERDREAIAGDDRVKHDLAAERRRPVAVERPLQGELVALPRVADLRPGLRLEPVVVLGVVAPHRRVHLGNARGVRAALAHHEHAVAVDERRLVVNEQVAAHVRDLVADQRIDHDVGEDPLERLAGRAALPGVRRVIAPLVPVGAVRIRRGHRVVTARRERDGERYQRKTCHRFTATGSRSAFDS